MWKSGSRVSPRCRRRRRPHFDDFDDVGAAARAFTPRDAPPQGLPSSRGALGEFRDWVLGDEDSRIGVQAGTTPVLQKGVLEGFCVLGPRHCVPALPNRAGACVGGAHVRVHLEGRPDAHHDRPRRERAPFPRNREGDEGCRGQLGDPVRQRMGTTAATCRVRCAREQRARRSAKMGV